MPIIKPFRGLRFSPAAGRIADLVSPPYDVISASERKELAAGNKYNFVRLVLPEDENGRTDTEKRYADTAERLQAWIAEGILERETSPAFYVYSQEFKVDDRTYRRSGFMGACLLEKFGEGSVHPHEKTLSGPKIDRLKLTKATSTQLSQIFCTYPDTERKSVEQMARIMESREPAYDFEWRGRRERLWVVTGEEEQAVLAGAVLESGGLYIADGHHRYETAWAFSVEYREKNGITAPRGELPSDYVLMMVVPMEDPGLVVLPTHRLVYGAPVDDTKTLLDKAREIFTVTEASDAELLALTETAEGPVRFGLADSSDKRYILELKDLSAMENRVPSRSDAWRSLDVAVLHQLLLEDLLGIDAAKLERKENITYVKSAGEALKLVEEDRKYQWAFMCRPTRLDQVKDVADNGEVMPQKSTYFYPKLMAGLVARPLTAASGRRHSPV